MRNGIEELDGLLRARPDRFSGWDGGLDLLDTVFRSQDGALRALDDGSGALDARPGRLNGGRDRKMVAREDEMAVRERRMSAREAWNGAGQANQPSGNAKNAAGNAGTPPDGENGRRVGKTARWGRPGFPPPRAATQGRPYKIRGESTPEPFCCTFRVHFRRVRHGG
jgi:hypothetical protein